MINNNFPGKLLLLNEGERLGIDIWESGATLMGRLHYTITAAFGIALILCLNSCGSISSPETPAVIQSFKPTAWLAESLAKRDAPPREPDSALPPVVIVHGIDGCARDMARLSRALQASGRVVHAIDLVPNDGSVPIEDLSGQLDEFIDDRLPGDAAFDITGYSMGGIVARHYLQERSGHLRARRFVSISSPHHGTLVAWLRRGEGARQMRIGSRFLDQLAASESMRKLPNTTSFQTTTDLIIVPFTSSTLEGARNVRLFGWGHFTGIIEPHALRRIVAELNEP